MQKATSSPILHCKHIGSKLMGCDLYLVVDDDQFVMPSSLGGSYAPSNTIKSLAPHSAALKSFKAKTSAAAPTPVTWPPSKAELERGIQLDKDGNISFSEKAREALDYPSRNLTTFV